MTELTHKQAAELRLKIQSAEKDSRDGVREELHFNIDKDGHWDQFATDRFKGRPRYQVNLIKPVNDSLAANLTSIEYGGTVAAVGGDASEDTAEVYEKMCRTISNISNSNKIYRDAAENIVDHGFDSWLVTTDWSDVDSFDQDIMIQPIINSVDRVWLEGVAEALSIADIKRGFVDTSLSLEEYKNQFPEGAQQSVDGDFDHGNYNKEQDMIVVSDFYYIKEDEVLLHLMSDGKVISDEEYQKIGDELAVTGVRSVRQRKRNIPKCFMRKMDASGWLTDELATPFSYIPVVTCMGNFKSVDGRAVYFGNTRDLMDSQRIYDYAISREIADGALAPVDKIAMTTKQAKGHEVQNKRLNSATDPVFLYNPDEKAPPPYRTGGPQSNPQLINTMTTAASNIKEISQSHSPQQGAGLAGHSGKAYEILTEQANLSAEKYKDALKDAVAATYKIIIDAIPRVYDTKARQMRLTNEDGTTEFSTINEEVYDQDTGKMVAVNDLSKGQYSFTVTAGPSYSSQKSKTVDAISTWASLDPSLLQEGADIIYGSMQEIGMSQIAERKRKAMVDNGLIPESQLTDEERDKILQQIQQQSAQQPSPIDQATVQAIMAEVQNISSQVEERQSKTQVALMEQQRKMMETLAKIEKGRAEIQKTQSETLENLKDATGADAIISSDVAQAYEGVAQDMNSRPIDSQ